LSSYLYRHLRHLHSFPTRRSSDLALLCGTPPRCPDIVEVFKNSGLLTKMDGRLVAVHQIGVIGAVSIDDSFFQLRQFIETLACRSEEHTSELQSRENLVCRLLLEK